MLRITRFILIVVAFLFFARSEAQLTLPITFDNSSVTYTMTDFDGGTTALVANPDATGLNMTPNVLQMIKNGGQVWGGSKLSLAAPLDFSTNNTFKMMVYSPRVGCPVLFKLEESGGAFVERTTNTTVANAWEELSWDFAGPTTNLYTDLTFIYDLGVMGNGSANFTFYQDEIRFVPGGVAPAGLTLPITFDNANITYTMTDFDGGTTALLTNPFPGGINTTPKVLQMVKNGGQVWGGSKLMLSSPVDFSSNTTFKMRVYSPRTGCPVLFKLEGPGGVFVERTTTTTVANAWEELSWDFSGSTSNTYNEITFIYDLGVMGDGSANFTFYQDEIQFVNGSGLNQIDLPVTFEATNVNYALTDFGGNYTSLVQDPMNAGNTVAMTSKNTGSEVWAGTTIGTSAGFDNVIPFTATNRQMSVQVYSPDAGIPIRLKIEVHGQSTQSVETDAMTTVANAWQYLTFDFNNNVAGTPAFDAAFPYDMASIFFNFGTDGNTAGDKTYYWDNVQFGIATSIDNPWAGMIHLYPNPVSQVLSVTLPETLSAQAPAYAIVDMTGRTVQTGTLSSQTQIKVNTLVQGIYSLQIMTPSNATISQRFVKQ